MNNQATLDKMRELKFAGMREQFETLMQTGNNSDMSTDEIVAQLIDSEWNCRNNRKIDRNVKSAKLRYQNGIEDLNFNPARGMEKNYILRLADCNFIKKGENILITGPTGSGKSFLASALGNQACIRNYKVKYYNTSRLLMQLNMSKADNSYLKMLNQIKKIDLIILDDFGLQPISETDRVIILEIIEDRYGSKSTIFTSQLPIAEWYEIIGENTIADAILDRIVHNSHRMKLEGDSMRKRKIST